ncbi:MAG: RidA family protein [Pseudomonadota bacterium]
MSKEVVVPAGSETTYNRFHFAPAVKASNGMIFMSGVIGSNPDGSMPEDIETQTANAFESISKTLEAAGSSLGEIVDITSFHIGLNSHVRGFMSVKDKYIKEPYPCWTAIGTTELAMPGGLVEIRVVAQKTD